LGFVWIRDELLSLILSHTTENIFLKKMISISLVGQKKGIYS